MHGRWERQALAENFRLLERESWRQAGGGSGRGDLIHDGAHYPGDAMNEI